MFLTRENDIFAFQIIAITTRETTRKEILVGTLSRVIKVYQECIHIAMYTHV